MVSEITVTLNEKCQWHCAHLTPFKEAALRTFHIHDSIDNYYMTQIVNEGELYN